MTETVEPNQLTATEECRRGIRIDDLECNVCGRTIHWCDGTRHRTQGGTQ